MPNAFQSVIDEKTFAEAQERIYWMFPSNWRRGINAIKKTKKNIRNDILKWLLDKGLTDFEAAELVTELPIIFSIQFVNRYVSHCCFLITEKLRRYENVLGVSINMESKKMIENFFLLSTQDFTRTNFLTLSNDCGLYHSSKITADKIEEVIKLLIRQLKKSQHRYRNKYDFVEH